MSNRVSPDPRYELAERAGTPRDSSHLFQSSQQQQQQQQDHQDNDNYTIDGEDDVTELQPPQQDEYLQAISHGDTLKRSDPVVTLPEEASPPDADTVDQSEDSKTLDNGTSQDEDNPSPLLSENNTSTSAVTAPVAVQGRLPPLSPRTPLDQAATDVNPDAGFTSSTNATTIQIEPGAGESETGEQTTHFPSFVSRPSEENQAAYSHATSAQAAHSTWDYNSGQNEQFDRHNHSLEQREQHTQGTVLRERQLNTTAQMSTTNSRPNSAKRESEVIGGEYTIITTFIISIIIIIIINVILLLLLLLLLLLIIIIIIIFFFFFFFFLFFSHPSHLYHCHVR
ncbi:hypothetical protein ElyMa_004744700 [Elysia marginata]|uniref:Syndecan/Neurexin domain-containing protein n=1 Tax=Elysia marginata TaxID=1093978 RepID=A0AAV4IBY9_9GAST|nr:hypothetical protein ElyMa_004744700 [Elysia marginata]